MPSALPLKGLIKRYALRWQPVGKSEYCKDTSRNITFDSSLGRVLKRDTPADIFYGMYPSMQSIHFSTPSKHVSSLLAKIWYTEIDSLCDIKLSRAQNSCLLISTEEFVATGLIDYLSYDSPSGHAILTLLELKTRLSISTGKILHHMYAVLNLPRAQSMTADLNREGSPLQPCNFESPGAQDETVDLNSKFSTTIPIGDLSVCL
ncbi:unnamed protein product [Tuber aestivum]|uniref:Uncharacterized protein n=1 Tax=Tuber aestivum TaxID=59557 RepID=A0A292Q917_9PEZI|nr:unnamed protein product [Tuber aestivum]